MFFNRNKVWCDGCSGWVDDVLYSYVDLPDKSIEEVEMVCQKCNHVVLRRRKV